MRTITEHIRRHLLDISGFSKTTDLLDVVSFQCEWSLRFMTLMINRITVGHFRYGAKDTPIKKDLDYIGSVKSRLKKYENSGNLEHMVDIANLCMLEFECGKHPKRHFRSIDDGQHVEEF